MPEPFFRIEMLPAKHGDALLVEWGRERTRRLLIDGGPLHAYPALDERLRKLPAGDQGLELLVISHVDTDHIEGIVRLLALPEARWPVVPEEIWFNGWRHIEEAHDLGGREGEFLSALIHRRAFERWNARFGGQAVRVRGTEADRVALADRMALTLVSPDAESLAALREDWAEKVKEWELEPGDLDAAWERLVEETKFHPDAELTLGPEDLTSKLRKLLKGRDPSTANGSSIAFLAEFNGKSCLFLADAHAKVVCAALEARGYSKAQPLKIDAVKVSHHGSRNNVTPELLELIDAEHFLVSTNGDKFKHPDAEAIQAIIQGARRRPTLWFNYRTPFTEPFERDSKGPKAKYRTRYPAPGAEGMTVRL